MIPTKSRQAKGVRTECPSGIPCDEAAVVAAIKASIRPPLMIVKLAEGKQITAGDVSREQGPDDDWDDYEDGNCD
jgi:hypothetical protein